jgi:hypothetical protein
MTQVLLNFHTFQNFSEALSVLQKEGINNYDYFSSHDFNQEEGFKEIDTPPFQAIKVFALIGAVFGLASAALTQWFASAISAPINIGGRPLNSWPAFIPITFVITILFTGLFSFLGYVIGARIPQPYQPIFNFKTFRLDRNYYYILLDQSDFEKMKMLNPVQVEFGENA